MTMTTVPWKADEHPRDVRGKFTEHAHSEPEQAIVTAVPWHLRAIGNLTPRSDADNPVLSTIRAGLGHGDTLDQWREEIAHYLDGENGPHEEIRHELRDALGVPASPNDVEHHTKRTQAWLEHAVARMDALVQDSDTVSAPPESGDAPSSAYCRSNDWCILESAHPGDCDADPTIWIDRNKGAV